MSITLVLPQQVEGRRVHQVTEEKEVGMENCTREEVDSIQALPREGWRRASNRETKDGVSSQLPKEKEGGMENCTGREADSIQALRRERGSEQPQTYHRKTNDGVSITACKSRFMTSSHVHAGPVSTPGALRMYSSQGGSISATSNFVPRFSKVSLNSFKSVCFRKPSSSK